MVRTAYVTFTSIEARRTIEAAIADSQGATYDPEFGVFADMEQLDGELICDNAEAVENVAMGSGGATVLWNA